MTLQTSTIDLAGALYTPAGIQDPFPTYRTLRETAPVYWSETASGWIVTGYREVREVYRSHDRFSSVGKAAQNLRFLPPDVRAAVPHVELVETTPALSSADQPVHTRQRALVMRPLTPRRLAQQRDWMEALCADLAEHLARQEQPDLIRDFSFPLTYRTILGLFGAPLDHVPLYQEATEARVAFTAFANPGAEAALRYERAVVALRDAIESIYPEARASGEGIVGSLLNPARPDDELDPDELFVMLKTFFAAGQENIIYSIPTAIHLLLRHPEQLELVREEPDLSAAAFEEAVRYDTPVHANPRVAGVDAELAGQRIRKGDQIFNFKGSANRDPAAWTDPDVFDLRRDQNEPEGGSVSFGQGIHFCAGAGVARLAGPAAIRTLVTRFPNLRLRDDWEPRWMNVPVNRKLVDLPLVLA